MIYIYIYLLIWLSGPISIYSFGHNISGRKAWAQVPAASPVSETTSRWFFFSRWETINHPENIKFMSIQKSIYHILSSYEFRCFGIWHQFIIMYHPLIKVSDICLDHFLLVGSHSWPTLVKKASAASQNRAPAVFLFSLSAPWIVASSARTQRFVWKTLRRHSSGV